MTPLTTPTAGQHLGSCPAWTSATSQEAGSQGVAGETEGLDQLPTTV